MAHRAALRIAFSCTLAARLQGAAAQTSFARPVEPETARADDSRRPALRGGVLASLPVPPRHRGSQLAGDIDAVAVEAAVRALAEEEGEVDQKSGLLAKFQSVPIGVWLIAGGASVCLSALACALLRLLPNSSSYDPKKELKKEAEKKRIQRISQKRRHSLSGLPGMSRQRSNGSDAGPAMRRSKSDGALRRSKSSSFSPSGDVQRSTSLRGFVKEAKAPPAPFEAWVMKVRSLP